MSKRQKLDNVTVNMLHAKALAQGKKQELLSAQGASHLTVSAVRLLFRFIEFIVEKKKKINCETLADKLCGCIFKEISSKFFEYNKNKFIQVCRYPKVERVTAYGLDGEMNQNCYQLFDLVRCQCIIAFNGFCSCYTRTILIHPTSAVMENYNFMVLIERKVIDNLRAGVQLSQVYKTVKSFATKENENLAKHLDNEFGVLLTTKFIPEYPPRDPTKKPKDLVKEYIFPTVSKYKDDSMLVNADTNMCAEDQMIFYIQVELSGLKCEGINYSLSIGDTVMVKNDGPADVLTSFKGDLSSYYIIQKK